MRTCIRAATGVTVVELLFTIALGTAITAAAIPMSTSALTAIRAAAAARYMAARIVGLRIDAARTSRCVALRFQPVGSDYAFAPFADGNGDGVRTADILAGIDRQVGPYERVGDRFAGIRFALGSGIPDADGAQSASEDGVRIGSPRLLSVSPEGTATSGTLYLAGRGSQFAVRVLGATGRTRVLFFHPGDQTWHSR
jgi:hypothetical protein